MFRQSQVSAFLQNYVLSLMLLPSSATCLTNRTYSDNPAASYFAPPKYRVTVFDETICSSISMLLNQCDEKHVSCKRVESKFATHKPKQTLWLLYLVKLDTALDGIIKVQNAASDAKYAALSYRWGVTQPEPTSLEEYSVEHSEMGIPVANLPKTIQDAVKVTLKQGMHYLWVDSLCLSGNSSSIEEHNPLDVSSIYSNAYVTISASSAWTYEDGFLTYRLLPSRLMNLPFRCEGPQMGRISLSRSSNSTGHMMVTEPADERAWV